MNLLPANFDDHDHTILYLAADQFALLVDGGRLQCEVSTGLHSYGHGLALPDHDDWYDFFFNPAAALGQFLDHARWIAPAPRRENEIILVEPEPLRALILRQLAQARQPIEHVAIARFSRETYSLGHKLTPEARQAIVETGNFLGQSGVCYCERPECDASYAWIQERVILLAVATIGLNWIKQVRVLPAQIDV